MVVLPRISLKRCFLYVVCITGMLFVLVNVKQKELWPGIRPEQVQQPRNLLGDNSKMKEPLVSSARPADAEKTPQRVLTTRPRRPLRPRKRPPPAPYVVLEVSSNVTGTTASADCTIDYSDPINRPWYMKGGLKRPVPAARSKKWGRRLARLWPDEDPNSDRVTNQLMFVPPDYNRSSLELRFKKIYIPHGMNEAKNGPDLFFQQRCPVNTCTIVRDNPSQADLVLFKDYISYPGSRPANQVWMLYYLECPYHTQSVKNVMVNWTATYRRDSDIVAPYERWQYYNPKETQIPQSFNYAANKTKKVAWFVSNCQPRNRRMQYAKELGKHIQVDIYGACGSLKCPRSQAQACFEMLDADYKFYLAFENSNCRDYITEKFFVNGLGHNVLPIVMGAHPKDYEQSAPYRSYIHVDEFESPKELAQYLHRLDQDDELYNSYFRWKGTGEFINTFFWCRVCAMLHDDQRGPKYYKNINKWWRGKDVCSSHSWREIDDNLLTT